MFAELKETCENELVSNLDRDTCLQILSKELFILTEALQEEIIDWIIKNLPKVEANQIISELPKELLLKALNRINR